MRGLTIDIWKNSGPNLTFRRCFINHGGWNPFSFGGSGDVDWKCIAYSLPDNNYPMVIAGFRRKGLAWNIGGRVLVNQNIWPSVSLTKSGVYESGTFVNLR